MTHKVAIILRTKNRPGLLKRALESIRAQTLGSYQLVLVNDGGDRTPVDCLLQEIGPAFGERLTVIHHPVSVGMEGASNRAIAASRSEYLAIHDDDDTWHPTFLEKCVAALDSAEGKPFGGALTHWWRVEEDSEGFALPDKTRREGPAPQDLGLYYLATPFRNFPPIAFVFRRSVYEAIGPYREDLEAQRDWEFNLRFLRHCDIVTLPEPLAGYHHRPSGAAALRNDSKGKALADLQVRLRGEWIRDELNRGTFGLGTLTSLSHEQYNHYERTLNILGEEMEKKFAHWARTLVKEMEARFERQSQSAHELSLKISVLESRLDSRLEDLDRKLAGVADNLALNRPVHIRAWLKARRWLREWSWG